ncbi:hypothetical protein ZIOFF_068201 [Zingiber officinale]|uniref:F-box domain-containing protein n=2 Tax=Zingiber officinale TaxID=94328 RepID=A0A8J5CGQ1_ZINOF|nr:hypothetical protein ZIOFF_068201 [Zingiber officinale]
MLATTSKPPVLNISTFSKIESNQIKGFFSTIKDEAIFFKSVTTIPQEGNVFLVSYGVSIYRENKNLTGTASYVSVNTHIGIEKKVHWKEFAERESVTLMMHCGHEFGKLPDHLLIEIFVRLPLCEWSRISCVNKHWAAIFRGESLWQTAIIKTWPFACQRKRWPGPIPRGSSRRRYEALYASKHFISSNGEVDELLGHTYLYLKEQLELSMMPPPSSILHGTMIDQFIACGKSIDKAHELSSEVWLAVINNLEENKRTFLLLKRLAQEGEFFLPFPYSRSYKVLWMVFEKLFTDFRDCLNPTDYYDVLACAKASFQPIPSTWLGY